MLNKVLEYAINAHGNQKYGNEPYLYHLEGVRKNLITILDNYKFFKDFDTDKIPILEQVAILHDTIEDTNITFEDIEEEFGHEIAQLVLTLTHSPHENYSDYIYRIRQDFYASFVKIADLSFNIEQSKNSLDEAKSNAKSKIKHRLAKYELAIRILLEEIYK